MYCSGKQVEGFHRGFESMLQINKPDVWKFLEAIHRQQALQEITVAQLKEVKQVVKLLQTCHSENLFQSLAFYLCNCVRIYLI